MNILLLLFLFLFLACLAAGSERRQVLDP